ncbi:MAG TPA: glycosyltransferase family 2 protein [Patescibacteria group bacterium]|nr:glycosyltransferase family 2 protein [Patescibacteria group bacterium]
MKLSIAIPTYNEEKNIGFCIRAVYDWVDEIVIVDGTSTDHTVEIAKKLDTQGKIKIFIEENPPNFLINKQKAIERCRGTWILQLDADEIVSEKLKKELILAIGLNQKNNFDQSQPIAYRIPRLNHFLGSPLRKGGQYPDYCLRLYRNGVARIPGTSLHDQVQLTSQKSQVESLKSPLLHYPYPTFEDYVKKWMKYNTFEAQELAKKGVTPSLFNLILYFKVYPLLWFVKTYIRHKGFVDGFPGFVFSLFSALRYWVMYITLFEISRKKS